MPFIIPVLHHTIVDEKRLTFLSPEFSISLLNKGGPSDLLMQTIFVALHYRGFCLNDDWHLEILTSGWNLKLDKIS